MQKSIIHLLHEFIAVSEQTAISAHKWIGRNDEKAADAAAVEMMRKCFNKIPFTGEIVIGEGERDKAPMLHTGEIVGMISDNAVECDIAVDPLEGTTICAQGGMGAMSTMVIGHRNTILSAPDIYMEKIALSSSCGGKIDLDNPIEDNIHLLAEEKKCNVSDITVAVLNRPRHQKIISNIINAGARVKLISDGDVAAAILTCIPGSGVDVYVGIGGAPEGVIAAAAVHMLGGYMQCRLCFDNEIQIDNTRKILSKRLTNVDPYKKYDANEMVNLTNSPSVNELIFIATGVTDGELVDGVKVSNGIVSIESLLIYRDAMEKTYLRRIKTQTDIP